MKKKKEGLEFVRDSYYAKKIKMLTERYPALNQGIIDDVLYVFGIDVLEISEFTKIKNCIQNDMGRLQIAERMGRSVAWTDNIIKSSPMLSKLWQDRKEAKRKARADKKLNNPGRDKMIRRLEAIEAMGYKVNYITKVIPIQVFRDLTEEQLLELEVSPSEIAKRKPVGGEKPNRKSIHNRFSEAEIKDMEHMLINGAPRYKVREKYKISDASIDKLISGVPHIKRQYKSNKDREPVVIDNHKLFVIEVLAAHRDGVSVTNIAKLFSTTEDKIKEVLSANHAITLEEILKEIIRCDLSIYKASRQFGTPIDVLAKYLFSMKENMFKPVDHKQKYSIYLRTREIATRFKEGESVIEIAEAMNVTIAIVMRDIHKFMPYPCITRYSTYEPEYDLKNWTGLQIGILDSDITVDNVVTLTGRPHKIVAAAKEFIRKIEDNDIGKLAKYHYVYNKGGM